MIRLFPTTRAHGVLLASAFALALSVVAGSATAQHVDEENGYRVRRFSKWSPVPVEPTERYMVARWASKRQDAHGWGQMHVYMFRRDATARTTTADPLTPKPPPAGPKDGPKKGPSTGTGTGTPRTGGSPKDREPPKLSDLKKMLDARPRQRSYQAWAKRNRRGLAFDKAKSIRYDGPDGVDLTANYYEVELGGRRGGIYLVVGVYSTPDVEFAVELMCRTESKRKNRAKFRGIAKSLRLLGAPLSAKERKQKQADKKTLSPREAARARARRDSKLKGWWYLESDNYFIVTNVERKKKGRVLDLKRRLEAIRKHYERDFTPVKEVTAVSIVRVCRDRKTYSQYGGPAGSAGYWNFVAEELVLFMQGDKDFARSVLYHEAFHQYLHYALGGDIRPHTWFNEGFADYYAGAILLRGRAVIKPFEWRVDTIRGHARAGTEVPMKKILKYSKRQYYADSRRCYAQGWSIVYFLNKGVSKDHPWRKILPKYYDVLKKSQSQTKALAAAFAQVNVDDLEAAWRRYTLKKTIARP